MKRASNISVHSQMLRDFKDKFKRKFLKRYDMPWMKSKELDIITEVVTNLQPKICFEWGSGYSTLLFPAMLPTMEKWISLEHHKEWFTFIAGEIKDSRVSVTLVEPDDKEYFSREGKYDSKKEGIYEDFKTYIAKK